jgi:hypothetical protein
MTFKKALYFVLASVALIALVACGGGSDDDNDNNDTGANAPEATQTSGGAQPAAPGGSNSGSNNATANELATLLNNFSKVKSFRAAITFESGGQKQEGSFEAVLPDRYHITLPGVGEFISIGADSYIKVGGSWTKQPGGGLGNLFSVDDISDTIAEFEADGVQKGGTSTVDGKRCQLYTTNDGAGASTEVCVADDLPVRIVIKTGSETSTIVFSDIDEPIDISAPI